jgi:hypothetical protein
MRRSSFLILILVLLELTACLPTQVVQVPIFTKADVALTKVMLEGFKTTLKDLGVVLNVQSAFTYEGDNPRALFAAADAFYTTNPGFCPLETGFYPSEAGSSVFLTLAGKGLEVRGFVYDLSRKPGFVFGFSRGVSKTVLKTSPCKTTQ